MSPLILNFPWLVLQVAVNQQLATLEEQLHPEGPIMQRVTSAGEDEVDVAVAGRKAEAEISILRRQQEDAYTKRASLEQRAELRQFLSSTDEQLLFELEDRIETLDAQIEYKSATIQETQAKVAKFGEEELPSVLRDAPPELQALMRQYVGQVVKVKQAEAQAVKSRTLVEQKLLEKEAQMEELENHLRAQEMELDRQLTQQAKEHELKTQYLLKQIKPQQITSSASASTDAERVMRMKDEQVR